jgi:hypothetical protein
MGLTLHSLGELPVEARRSYYIYLLDYGWDEPFGQTLRDNFDKMAALASRTDAVVIRGVGSRHFEDEVLSWHHINGQPGDEILPAILITTRHPRDFRNSQSYDCDRSSYPADRMAFIRLREVCRSPTDVVDLLEKIFRDIRHKKALTDFQVARELSRGKKGAIVDALILEPNFAGIGVNLNYILNFLLGRKHT